jgi:hypothetical protein
MLIRSVFAAFFGFALAACATAPEPPQAVAISLWQGGCYYASGCSDESFSLRRDGRFAFESGARGPDGKISKSTHEGQLEPKAFSDAYAVLRAAKFHEMPERMDATSLKLRFCMPHGPGVRIRVADAADAVKEVFWDTGCQSKEMESLTSALLRAMQAEAMRAPPKP